MRQETNNEIDLLLRRMGRQNGGSMHESEHLDVDELSSYAQNALPPAARARYTEHLAECSACRKIVTELSLSLGASVAAAPVETVSVPGGLKKFLASLFSPMVLRYAVPALGLIVVAVVGFVALRQRDRQDTVAQRTAEQARPVITASPQVLDDSKTPLAGYIAPEKETAAVNKVEQPKEAAPKSGAIATESSGTGPIAAAAPPVRDEKRAEEPPPAPKVESAPAPAKAAPSAESDEQKKIDAAAKKQEAVTVTSKDAEVSTARNEPVRGFENSSQAATRKEEKEKKDVTVQRRSAVGGVAHVFGNEAPADKDDADVRKVAGRRFRKERGIWTDTAYDSSTATVNVARGSEQFRALVADEPEIKKIAEQLDGEVIVVWKGRAYRIR